MRLFTRRFPDPDREKEPVLHFLPFGGRGKGEKVKFAQLQIIPQQIWGESGIHSQFLRTKLIIDHFLQNSCKK